MQRVKKRRGLIKYEDINNKCVTLHVYIYHRSQSTILCTRRIVFLYDMGVIRFRKSFVITQSASFSLMLATKIALMKDFIRLGQL